MIQHGVGSVLGRELAKLEVAGFVDEGLSELGLWLLSSGKGTWAAGGEAR